MKKTLDVTNAVNQFIKEELEDKNLRVTSEMINSNRRKDEECNRLLKYKDEDIISDLLIVIDNFERALSVKSDDEKIQNYRLTLPHLPR